MTWQECQNTFELTSLGGPVGTSPIKRTAGDGELGLCLYNQVDPTRYVKVEQEHDQKEKMEQKQKSIL